MNITVSDQRPSDFCRSMTRMTVVGDVVDGKTLTAECVFPNRLKNFDYDVMGMMASLLEDLVT